MIVQNLANVRANLREGGVLRSGLAEQVRVPVHLLRHAKQRLLLILRGGEDDVELVDEILRRRDERRLRRLESRGEVPAPDERVRVRETVHGVTQHPVERRVGFALRATPFRRRRHVGHELRRLRRRRRRAARDALGVGNLRANRREVIRVARLVHEQKLAELFERNGVVGERERGAASRTAASPASKPTRRGI